MNTDSDRFVNFTPECVDYNTVLLVYYRNNTDTVEWTSLTSVRLVFGALYLFIMGGGVIGNGGVIAMLLREVRVNARDLLLLNLMCADLLLCFTSVPITPVVIVWKEWYLGAGMCRCLPLARSASVMIISWTLAAIAIDKFVHITDITRQPLKLTHAAAFVAFTWCVAPAINVPYVLNYKYKAGYEMVGAYEMPLCGYFCMEKWENLEFKKAYGTLVLCVQFALPMTIISFCYTRILCIVQRDLIIKNEQFSRSLTQQQRDQANKMHRRVTYILVAMVLAFVLAWAPITLMNILRDYVPSDMVRQLYFYALCSHSTAMTTVLWNPILCFWLTSKAKRSKIEESVTKKTSVGNAEEHLLVKRSSVRAPRRSETTSTKASDEYEMCVTYSQTFDWSETAVWQQSI